MAPNHKNSYRQDNETPVEVWLEAGDTVAGFVPSVGFNCTVLRIWHNGEWRSTLAEPPTWEAAKTSPSYYGSPLLGPYAYGIRSGILEYGGERYTLAPGGEGRAQHGITRDHPWQVTENIQGKDEAWIRAHLEIGGGDPESDARLAEFPFPMDMEVTYTLQPGELKTTFRITNTGIKSLPLGIGIHPYFSIPMTSGAGLDSITLKGQMRRLPRGLSACMVGIGHEDCPDTFFAPLDQYLAHTPPGRPFLDLFERTESGLMDRSDVPLWSAHDQVSRLQIALRASPEFRFLGQYSPSHRQVLSPVVSTNRPGAFELPERGLDSGLFELGSGDTWHGWCSLQIGQDSCAE